ncbi:Protein CBG27876 [Caenorhabditis briggsae]|uniref:Protein CBG27876 n=1 Tax=Caenorhabditis briggsae TaxID=6238 RepID=B6IEH1_CAEBR|nr:Protein CBG27876 [Caenorhabditis briggsae]CAR98301.1 Protein CBG27876 [Caenorhabditis briggsae]
MSIIFSIIISEHFEYTVTTLALLV